MDSFRVKITLITLLVRVLTSQGQDVQILENGKHILPCRAASSGTVLLRQWRRGFRNETVTEGVVLFTQAGTSANITRKDARDDMTVDSSSFSLDIGRVHLEDNSVFTCYIHTVVGSYFGHTNLSVYTTQELHMTISPETGVGVGQTINVDCQLNRVFPELSPNDFIMEFNGLNRTPTKMYHDQTFSYKINLDLIAEKQYNGKAVNCEVQYGDIRSNKKDSRTLNILFKPEGKPTVAPSSSKYYLEEQVRITCEKGRVDAGNPNHYTYRWFHNDEEKEENGMTLTFVASKKEEGNYSCEFGNREGYTSRSDVVEITVEAILNPNKPSVLPAAVGGAVGFLLVLIIIVSLIVLCQRRKARKLAKQGGSSTAKLTRNGNLESVIVPPASEGAAEYIEIAPPREKPVPAKRSFKKQPKREPLYSEALPEFRGISGPGEQLYANTGAIYSEANEPTNKRPDVANNNENKLVYAQLDLVSPQKKKKPPVNHQPPPTEYAHIDFKKSGV